MLLNPADPDIQFKHQTEMIKFEEKKRWPNPLNLNIYGKKICSKNSSRMNPDEAAW